MGAGFTYNAYIPVHITRNSASRVSQDGLDTTAVVVVVVVATAQTFTTLPGNTIPVLLVFGKTVKKKTWILILPGQIWYVVWQFEKEKKNKRRKRADKKFVAFFRRFWGNTMSVSQPFLAQNPAAGTKHLEVESDLQ